MKITDSLDLSASVELIVEMDGKKVHAGTRPYEVVLTVFAEGSGDDLDRALFSVTGTAKTLDAAAEGAIAHLEHWIGQLGTKVHASAVRMRRMLTKEDGQ